VIHTKTGKIPSNAPAELRVVREWVKLKDRHDSKGMMELTDMDNCVFTFVDSEASMLAEEFYGAMNDICESFPDLHFFWESMKVVDNDCQDSKFLEGTAKVLITNYYGVGTHTGKPYHFGPYPPVEPQGAVVRDENIQVSLWIQGGTSIVRVDIHAFGKLVGPPGFYTKIGGLIM